MRESDTLLRSPSSRLFFLFFFFFFSNYATTQPFPIPKKSNSAFTTTSASSMPSRLTPTSFTSIGRQRRLTPTRTNEPQSVIKLSDGCSPPYRAQSVRLFCQSVHHRSQFFESSHNEPASQGNTYSDASKQEGTRRP